MPADLLAVHAQELLTSATAAIAPARTGHASPERTYVSHGDPAADLCGDGQLTVHTMARFALTSRPAGGRQGQQRQCAVVTDLRLIVTLFRCVPGPDNDGNPPSASALDTSAKDLLIDGWCLYTGVRDDWLQGALFEGHPCGNVSLGDLETVQPSGNYAGWRLELVVPLSGKGPEVGS